MGAERAQAVINRGHAMTLTHLRFFVASCESLLFPRSLRDAGQIRQVRSGKITTYRAVISGKEVSLLVDSFGKFIELP